jgi:hypothetical protein
MSGSPKPLHLFEGFGIEAEYMIVDRDTLAAKPISNRVLERMAGMPTREFFAGAVGWSNEIVLHVLELKANGPTRDLVQLHKDFKTALADALPILAEFNATLMPTSMHPLFVPDRETHIWKDEDAAIYAAYDRIFDCRGHGWSNLQSIHINFPFCGDEEFGVLHGAIRAVLPLLPALAQSSPIVEGGIGKTLDCRLHFYFKNQKRLPSIIGPVIPEAVFTKEDYASQILQPMYAEIAPYDPEGELQDEWLNSRAAIARFIRNAIEIRLLDIGECMRADFAVISMVTSLVKALASGRWCSKEKLWSLNSDALRDTLFGVINSRGEGRIDHGEFLQVFGKSSPASAMEIWRTVYHELGTSEELLKGHARDVEFLLENGAVGARIIRSLPKNPTNVQIMDVYRQLVDCLREDRFYQPNPG